MKNSPTKDEDVSLKMILAIANPHDTVSKKNKVQEYEFNSSFKMKDVNSDKINDAVSRYITSKEINIGGTCLYGHVNVYVQKKLYMEITIVHDAVRNEYEREQYSEEITYH